MTNFWPSDFDLADTSSPLEILRTANDEWKERSEGVVGLEIQEATSRKGNCLLIVHAKHVPSNRTVSLFSVVHRPDAPYPANIQSSGDELPDSLKRTYYRPGLGDMAAGIGVPKGRQVTNEGVCDTPSEFRAKLSDVFNLGRIKSEVLSLVSGVASSSDEGNDTEEGDDTEEGNDTEEGDDTEEPSNVES